MDASWMLDLEPMDCRAMLRDLGAAIERARAESRPEYLEDCLLGWARVTDRLRSDREWQRSQQLLADQQPGPC